MSPKDKEQDFRRIVKQYRNMLWHIISDYTFGASLQPDDCFQEVLFMLWRYHGSLRRAESERQWVYRVATTTMLMLRRKKSNHPFESLTTVEDPIESINEYYRQEDYALLWQLIDQLDRTSSLIVRAHLDGFTFDEIAVSMQMTTAAVSKRYSRAISKIKQQYENTL